MGKIKASYVTDKGKQMLFSGGTVNYTKAVLYSQNVSNLTVSDLRQLASLTGELMTTPVGVSDKQDGSTSSVNIEATFINAGLDHDIEFHSVGWFAKQGDNGTETLMAVQVANNGANLAAGSPNGATDAVDLTLSFAIGDATTVTAVIDPAGSVTPTELHNAITDVKSEMNTALDTKADKSAVDSDVKSINDTLATKANTADVTNSLDLKADKQTVIDDLAKKADQDDVAAKLATKADKTDVDTQIGTVTKSVSDLSATVKSNKDDADKALATKADKATVESDLATKASQSDLDKTNSEVAKKADSEDVNAQLVTKANSKDVNDALALKDDTADVDDKISNVTKSVSDLSATVTANKKATDSTLATKANASDVADSLATKADKTDVASDVKSLNDAINTKASQADLDKTNAVVATKANATALADYARTVDVDAGLDTKANKTDLESLAKTADVNSALDTKADKATVNSDIKTINNTMATKASQSDLDKTNATMATKADKTTVDGDVKTLQASIDTKADKTALDDYAKSADVASDVKTLTDSIATKADAKTVNDAISKIDFTPYAKSADVDSKLKGYTDTADLTKLLAGKADSDFSYSKAELDKKLLDLTTTTGGKVDASQVATMIENKADKSDVTKQIGTVTDLVNTKANSTDVDAALDKKDDITDVDAKIKKVTDLANKAQSTADSKVKSNWAIDNSNGKFVAANVPAVDTATQSFTQTGLDLLNTLATKSQVADAKNTANQAIDDYNKRPVIRGNDGDDLLAYKTNQLRLYVDVKNCKNLPPASNTQWFTVEYIFENPNGDGVAIFRSPASEVWLNGNNGGNYNNWLRLANAGDITNLQNAINTKANSSDVYSKSEVDSKTTTTIVTGYDIPSKTRQTMSAGVNAKWLVDPSVIDIVADQINQLKGRRTADSPDFNSLTDGGSYYITNPLVGKNGPTGSWGNLLVSNGNGHRISQLYFPDDGSAPFMRELDESTWHNWIQLSTKQDVNNAANLANAASNKVDTVLANSYVRKQGMNANGDCVEIKHTGIKQANGGYAFDMWSDDWTASKLQDVIKNQLPSKADKSQVNVSGNLFNRMTDDSTWKAITGVDNTDNAILTSIRDDSPVGGNTTGGNGSAIAFGGSDTKAVLSVHWLQHEAKITSGNGSGPKWVEDVAWKSDINNTNANVTKAQSTADSANTNANGRLSKAGDTMNTKAVIQWNGGGIDDKTGNLGGMNWSGGTDWAEIYGDQDNNDNLDLAFDLGDDGSNHFSFRKNGTETSAITSDGHYTGTVDWGHVNGRPDVATKADVNSINSTISAMQQTIKTLQDTITKQATTITGLQTQVNNQAQDIAYIKANYIEGKRFSKANETAADAWEKVNSQRLAFITDN